jgi:GPH family glycoside/pentoside/hexuronide:cation symporter
MNQLSFSKKFSYSMGGLAMNLTNLVISQWIMKKYIPDPEHALVPIALFSAILMFGRITDAITDPLIGYWSDNFKSKYGRRKPFILFGTIPLAIVFFLIWIPPVDGMSWINAIYAFVLIQLYFIFYTIVVTPYLSLLPEITSNLKERVNISTLQAVFVMLGTIVFALVGVFLNIGGWLLVGLIVAILTIISFIPTTIAIKEKSTLIETSEKMDFISSIRLTLKNKPFLYLVASTSFYWFGLNLVLMLVPYWVQNFHGLAEDAVPLFMGPFLVMNIAFFFVVNYLAKKNGKYKTFLVTSIATAAAVSILSLIGLNTGINQIFSPVMQSAIIMGIIGIPVAGFLILPYALLSDVADYDEQISGKRREAIFFGVQAIFQKSMIGLSIVIFSSIVLSNQTIEINNLRIIPIIAAVSFILGFIIFLKYPIREKGEKIILTSKEKK